MTMEEEMNPHKRSRSVERFKGVVPQQNGHWGAQIYANNKRVWLGTFNSEVAAAAAYDSAAINLLTGDSHRNFPSPNVNLLESKFQSHFTSDIVLAMIRDGTYPSKFADFLRNKRAHRQLESTSPLHRGFSFALLFQKELTPSDVGKLNRLVIPKRYAEKHFPKVPEDHSEVQLEFYDRQMSPWKFRYCYWKSSQSFVFTRGWNRFVKEKGLRANDTIAFYTCDRSQDVAGPRQKFLVIDVSCRDHTKTTMSTGDVVDDSERVEMSDSTTTTPARGFRLFGVQIIDH